MPSNPCKQAAARRVLQNADAVCFDVDSTVCKDEGLDELAEFCGVGKQVKEWDFVALLQSRNIQVFLVSGGFRRIIEPAARLLNIPLENIFANRLLFKNGQYSGFDTEEPTSESGGKTRVTGMLKEKHGLKNLVMIGDGATDMEASPPADAFIGYGGNVVRDKVKNNADWFVTDFKELISALQEPKELTS